MMAPTPSQGFHPSHQKGGSMRVEKRRSFLLELCVFLRLSVVGVPARADLSLGFSNGLTGWTSSDASLVEASNGQATITESASALATDLYLTFTIPTGAQSLQFTLVSAFP